MSEQWREIPLKICDRIGDFAIYATARFVILSPLVVARGIEYAALGIASLARMFANSYQRLVVLYDALPYGAIQLKTIESVEMPRTRKIISPIPLLQLLNDSSEEKELMILGTKGSGKSTLAQFLAYSLGGHTKVYEPEGTPWDWQGLEVLGKGENWEEIEQGMAADLEHLTNQLQIRRERGDEALTATDRIIIGEEYPEIADKVLISEQWLERHARRGRKARVRLILLSQFDQAAAWGMDGKLQLLACFYRLRLTKMAKAHALKLKRDDLADWLEQSRRHALLDDSPVLLPSYEEMKRVIQQNWAGSVRPIASIQPGSEAILSPLQDQCEKTPEKTPETPENQGFQPPGTSFSGTSQPPDIEFFGQVLGAFADQRSDDWIAKNLIMASMSIGYPKAKEKAAKLRELWRGGNAELG